jgi:acyl carrier protein
MMLIVRLEQDYAIEFSGDEIADLRSVGDIRATLQAHGVQP